MSGPDFSRKLSVLRRIQGRLIGVRVVESTPDHMIVRFPMWVSDAMADNAIDGIAADWRIRYPDAPISVTRGHRLVRIQRLLGKAD